MDRRYWNQRCLWFFLTHSIHSATCFIDEDMHDVELVIKRTFKLKPRESRAFQRAFITLKVTMIAAMSSSHQPLYIQLLVIQSRLSALVSNVNLLLSLTFGHHVESSAECTFILSNGDTSDSNTMVARGNEGWDSARSEVQLQCITHPGSYFLSPDLPTGCWPQKVFTPLLAAMLFVASVKGSVSQRK